MRRWIYALIAVCVVVCRPGSAEAQESRVESSRPTCVIADVVSDQCLKEFTEWVKADLKYRKWAEYNRNRLARGGWGTPQQRQVRPVPPEWLLSYCAGTFQADVTSDQICAKYNALKEFDWLGDQSHKMLAQLRQQNESPTHTSFKQRIHIDVGYTAAQFPSPHIYGLIGIHVGLVPLGPCQANVIPGHMLMSVPEGIGGRKLQPAITLLGGSCRLSRFTFPGTKQKGALHANLARVHVLGQTSEQAMLGGADLSLVGLSITFR